MTGPARRPQWTSRPRVSGRTKNPIAAVAPAILGLGAGWYERAGGHPDIPAGRAMIQFDLLELRP